MLKSVFKRILLLSLSAVITTGGAITASAAQKTDPAVNAINFVTSQTANSSNGFGYAVKEDGTLSITKYTGSSKSVSIPAKIDGKTVTAIAANAFKECTAISEIKFPNSIEYIGGFAFEGCKGLRYVILPASLKEINGSAFIGCSSLEEIYTDKQNRNFVTVDGVLFNRDRTTLLAYPTGRKGAYTVPDTVTRIHDYAFGERNALTKVVIPSSVKTIGFNAFEYCAALKKASLANGLEEIETGAFNGCKALTDITLPASAKRIHSFAFAECHSLKTIALPEGLTLLDFSVFEKCYSLRFIKLPSTLRRIYANALGYCTSLESIRLPAGTDELFGLAFCECRNLKSVTILNKNARIDKIAFDNCRMLTIYGKQGSTAETYAKQNGIPFATGTAPAADLSTITLSGNDLTVNAKAFDGKAPYKYAVSCLKPGATDYKIIQDFSKNDVINICAKKSGTYIVRISIKDSAGKVTVNEYTVRKA